MAGPRVGIVLGAGSDEDPSNACAVLLEKFAIDHEIEIMSPHRNPQRVAEYASSAEERGLEVIIAAGGGSAAALPGAIAAYTTLPVIGLPISNHVAGNDSPASMTQMPSGVPVAAVGVDAAANAAILAIQILAVADPGLRRMLHAFKQQLSDGLRL